MGWSKLSAVQLTRPEQTEFLDKLAQLVPFPVVVTSGTRSMEAQVDALFTKADIGGLQELKDIYPDDFAVQIWEAYPDKDAALELVQADVAAGRGSAHLSGLAVDLRTRDLSSAQIELLEKASQQAGGIPFLELVPPHLHVRLIGQPSTPASGSSTAKKKQGWVILALLVLVGIAAGRGER